jgi:hypothetical protein
MSTLKQHINLTGFITVFIIQTGFYKRVRFAILGFTWHYFIKLKHY